MSQENTGERAASGEEAQDRTRDNQEAGLEAEQESAEAMDAEVPQPSGADKTTEGQPS